MSASQAKPETSASTPARFSSGPDGFTFYDVFFWRDAPDWYRKACQSTGMGFAVCALKQYLNRHELDVYMPPRSKVLPERMRKGYRNTQYLKYGFLKVGKETTIIAAASVLLYAPAFYLGRYREAHTWHNFAVSGSFAGAGVGAWLLPWRLRPLAFAVGLGAGLGTSLGLVLEGLGMPFWDERYDFEGYFLGQKINLKEKPTPST